MSSSDSDESYQPPQSSTGPQDDSAESVRRRPTPSSSMSPPPHSHWCMVTYYERDQQLGDIVYVALSEPNVMLDGLINPEPRPDQSSIRPRRRPKVGIRLESKENGDVWLENLSENPIYISSPHLDRLSGRPVGEGVHKIYPRAGLKVFDIRETRAAITERAEITSLEVLKRHCLLKISFAKGWGPDFKRATIQDCPSWIEVSLTKAIRILESHLPPAPRPGTAPV